MNLAIVSGAATPPGRLRQAVGVLEDLAYGNRLDVTVTVVDLSAMNVEICDGRPVEVYDQDTQLAIRAVLDASAVILASPIYRATYPGVLKNLLDLLPIEALRDKPVGILAMGASLHHYLGVDSQLRFVLAWFGALVAPTSVYLTGQDFKDGRLVSGTALNEADALVNTVLILAERIGDTTFGPDPLAAKARS